VRQLRPSSLDRAARSLRQAGELSTLERDASLLNELATELEDLAEEAEAQEPDYRELFVELNGGGSTQASELLYTLTRKEREISTRLDRVQAQVEAQITLIAQGLANTEQQLVWALLFLSIGALIMAGAVTFFSYRSLTPLSRLTEGVIAVGTGDLRQRVVVSGSGEIGTLAREFNQMVERLVEREERLKRSERLAAIGELAAKVTHEIRNPLNSLGLATEMLWEDLMDLGDEETTAEPRHQLATMTRDIERLTVVTGDYLRFARLPKLNLEPHDLNEIIAEFIDSREDVAGSQGVEVELELAEELPKLPIDKSQITQVLDNLFRNACEAMPDGGVITLRTGLADKGATLEVDDRGEGIEPDRLDKIFEPFVTSKERGTGLGLPLTQQIITEHGGTIKVSSERGEGTRFSIWLPLVGSNETPDDRDRTK
jgi:signal transduction histidine kinase